LKYCGFLETHGTSLLDNTQGCPNLGMYPVKNMGCGRPQCECHIIAIPKESLTASAKWRFASKDNLESRCESQPAVRNHLPLSVVPSQSRMNHITITRPTQLTYQRNEFRTDGWRKLSRQRRETIGMISVHASSIYLHASF
jgi:hypothetical protein